MVQSRRVGVFSVAALAALAAVAAPGTAGEAIVETRDGRRYEGELISETDGAVVIELRQGTIVGRVTIPRADVARLRRVGPDPAAVALERRAAAARAVEDPAARAQALLALAQEVELEADPRRAGELYLEAGRADPALRDQTDVAAARAFIAGDRYGRADAALREALERNPKNAQAQAQARRLEEALGAKAAELVEPGVQAFLDDRPRRALSHLERAVEELPGRALDEASARTQDEVGLTLPQIMVDCRLRASCWSCEGAGVYPCPAADDRTRLRCRFGRRVRKLRPRQAGAFTVARWERCQDCDGRGHLTCEDCGGLGLNLGRPTTYERDALVETLTGTLAGLEERAGALDGKAEEAAGEVALRSVAATELIGVLQGIRGYSKVLSKLDPTAGAIGGGDLRRRAHATSQRLATIMTALANALYLGGERRYEDAVATPNPLSDDVDTLEVPADVRAMRARQAWEAVNQARIFTLEALELDPATASPLRGDLHRRLALMEGFLARTWDTYMALRASDGYAADRVLGDPDLRDRIAKQAERRLLGGAR